MTTMTYIYTIFVFIYLIYFYKGTSLYVDIPNSLVSLEFPSAIHSLLPQKFCLQQN